MVNTDTLKIFREGRYWEVWNTANQQCIARFWSKAACAQLIEQMKKGIDPYAVVKG